MPENFDTDKTRITILNMRIGGVKVASMFPGDAVEDVVQETYRLLLEDMTTGKLTHVSEKAIHYRVFRAVDTIRRLSSPVSLPSSVGGHSYTKSTREQQVNAERRTTLLEGDHAIVSPEDEYTVKELLDILREVIDKEMQMILDYLLAGYTHSEVSQMTKIPPRTLRRKIKRLREVAGDVLLGAEEL